MWESEVTEKSSSPSPCPPSSSSSSWNMMNIMGHHHHHHHGHDHDHDPHHDHHVKQGSIAPCHVSQPLVPHLNNYKLIKALGNGSMGTVFLGLFLDNPPPSSDATKDEDKAPHEGHTSSSFHVKPHVSSHDLGLFALKVMSKEEMWRKGMVKRASMEKEVLMACSDATRTGTGSGGRRSPFLPSLKAHFESETHQVLVMDYCCGGDLNHLRSCKAKEGSNGGNKFSEEDARFYGAEIILALEKLHELGFVYRDLKPENVMVRGDGHIMLADFDLCLKLPSQQPPTPTRARTLSGKIRSLGKLKRWVGDRMASSLTSCVNASESARVSGSSSGTTRVTPVLQAAANAGSRTGRSLSFVGTEEYVAPEILWGTGHDLAVDWWTLGILLFDLVAGTTPFKSLTRKETFFNILCKEPKLDTCLPTASPQFLDLVSRLLCKQPSDRLGFVGGAHEIKSHPFFHGVNWDSHHEIPNPPYTPSPHMLVLDLLEDNDTLLESQLTIAEHRRRLAHASANEHVHTHHHDFRVF